jgi:tetratricopeptide (TPR) repeat protein
VLELAPPALFGLGFVLCLLTDVDGRICFALGSLATFCIALSLVSASRRVSSRVRVAFWLIAVIVGLGGALEAWTVSANWQLYKGYALEDQGRTDESVAALEAALTRMDAPALFSLGRYRLTAYGPVFESRVTPLIAIARIRYDNGEKSASIESLEAAKAAAIADPREGADMDFLNRMIDEIREQSS